MSLHQVIYTSCMRGIKGVNDGQQVFSYDAQFTYSDNDEVKSLYSYKPPELEPGVRMSEEIALTLPKSYIYRRLDDGRCTLSLSTYLGRDYMGSAGRFGNHLSHVVVADESDITNYPCEYFGSSTLRDHMEFEEVNNPEPPDFLPTPVLEKGYTVDVDTVIEFLSIGDRLEVYQNMLCAMLAFSKDHKRLVICDETENIIMWIAALEYALPLKTALKINFTTYEYDPSLSASQICGVVPNGTRYTDESKRLHFVFDFYKNEYADLKKDNDFYEFIDTVFSLSFESIQDFHAFIESGYSYEGADEELYSAYILYSILSDGIGGTNTEKLSSALAFAEKYASVAEKSKIVNNLISQYNELLIADRSVFASVLGYIFSIRSNVSNIDDIKVKQLAVDRLLLDFTQVDIQEQSFTSFYNDIDKICKQYGINLSTEIMMDSNRTKLFSVVQNDVIAWKIAFIIRVISRYAKSKRLPIEELSSDRPFGHIYYELIQKVQKSDSSNTSFLSECVLDEFEDDCTYLVNMSLNLEGMILDTPNSHPTVDALWEHFCKKMLSKQTDNFSIAYNILLEYDREKQLFMLFDLEMQHISDADKCKLSFDNHFDNIVRKSRTYSNQYGQKILTLYYNSLSKFNAADSNTAKRALFELIVDEQLESSFADDLIEELVSEIPLSAPTKENEKLIKSAFQYTYNLRRKPVKGKTLLLLIGMIMDSISIKEQVEKKLEQLKVLTNRNLADLTSVSEKPRNDYFNWILPLVFKWCKNNDLLTRFYNLYEMSNGAKRAFICELAKINLKDAKENKDNLGFVEFFGFVSYNGTSAIREEIGKTLCKFNKNKMAELDEAMKEYYSKDKKVLSHWSEVKEVAGSTNPILNNIANLFRRKKKGD